MTKNKNEALTLDDYKVTGYENVGTKDLSIPFLVILQKGSSQVDKTNPSYESKTFPGAEEGMIINSNTSEVYYQQKGPEMEIVPCGFETCYVEWRPRGDKGGFVTAHRGDEILKQIRSYNDKRVPILANGNELKETKYHFVLVNQDGLTTQCVIPFGSTQIKKSKNWLSIMSSRKTNNKGEKYKIQSLPLPMFFFKCYVSLVAESNKQGSWWGWKIRIGKTLLEESDPLFIEGFNVAQTVNNAFEAMSPTSIESGSGGAVLQDNGNII
tara:strand:- start:5470 stop:6273 length:804 start_codon:yes stop_codon:yes gene_type:complete